MKSIIWSRKSNFLLLLLVIVSIAACKKSKVEPEPAPVNVPQNLGQNTKQTPTTDRTFLTNDSLFLYAQQIYFWNDALPDYDTFDPRRYKTSPDITGYNQELFAITRFKINPITGNPYEYSSTNPSSTKYSYINDILSNNPQPIGSTPGSEAAVDLAGNGNDIGIRAVFYLTSNVAPRPYLLFVTAVYPGSPADKAGVKRGWVIKTVNGSPIGASYDSESANVLASMNATSVALTGYNAGDNNLPFSLTLFKASYKSSPVYASKVISRSGKKIGYLSYARFSALTSFDTPNDVNLDPVFADFSAQGVTDLIIDLRYNGGGYVESATYLANLIAPSSLTGKKMYTEIYNSTMQSGKATILSHQPLLDAAGKIRYRSNGVMLTYADLDYSTTAAVNNTSFSKKGNVNGVNVVFIVSGNTASASELLINSLKPYLNVKLVGTTTYGKPVGFFPIVLQNRYEVFMSLFETRNSNNEGSYYSGMVPDVQDANDDPRYPFGDERDNYLSLALNLLVPTTTLGANRTSSVDARVTTQSAPFNTSNYIPLDPNSEFVGMIETRKGLK